MNVAQQSCPRSPGARLAGPRHGLGTTLVLHLGPGAVFAAASIALGRLAIAWSLPPAFGLLAASVLVLVPLQLGVIAVAARHRTGSWALGGALGYTKRLPARRFWLLGVATLAWAALVFVSTAPVGEAVRVALFSWWPAELDYAGHLLEADRYSRGVLVAAWTLGLVVTTILVPIVEELYFRSYLLPRLEHLGSWAPVLNTVLFALYHVWSPWQAATRIVATLPLYYATWRTRAVWLAIVVHVVLNLVGDTIATAPIVFG